MAMDTPDERLLWARTQFSPSGAYLDTATAGLPPAAAWDALRPTLADWRGGDADAVAYDRPVERSRSLFADLVGTNRANVAVGPQTSVFVGLVAASLPEGAEVLTAEGDFTSVLFPFYTRGSSRLRVREVPLEQLAESVTRSTYLVAVSAVQSSDGRVADLEALSVACAATGTQVLLDATQAAGWLPIEAGRFDYVVASGYKWLLAARGTAFLAVAPARVDDLRPIAAGWYAGADPWQSIYGSPLRLADDAKRFDVSPAWHSWVTQAPALELLAHVGKHTLQTNAMALSRRFCDGVGVPFGGSAIVSLGIDDEAPARLADAGVSGSMRAGRLRVSFHVSTSEDDVDRAVDARAGHVAA
ncbi:MAG: aminotransferase class V-fold PLP-dependent enzyme [Streptosporangiaceae bacterium]